MGNIFLQLACMQHCRVASWKALLHVLPPTSNIVTQPNSVAASWSSMLQQVELASTFFNNFFQLATTNFVAWHCLRWVIIRTTMLFNLQFQHCFSMLRCKLQRFVARITSPYLLLACLLACLLTCLLTLLSLHDSNVSTSQVMKQ